MKRLKLSFVVPTAALAGLLACASQRAIATPVKPSNSHQLPEGSTLLRSSFESPPHAARPLLWWHWMNGNVNASGVRKDLHWMHKIGIGGVDVISAALLTPHVVKPPVTYMSSAWKDDFSLAARLTGKYGMGLSIDSSPGWSQTGGPWVKPKDAMKKLVWSRTIVQGGRMVSIKLPKPPSNTGSFQDTPMFQGAKFRNLKFYRDAAVVAYREPSAPDQPMRGVTSGGHALTSKMLNSLSDGNFVNGIALQSTGSQAWIDLDYPSTMKLQGLTLAATVSGAHAVLARLFVRNNVHSKWKLVDVIEPFAGTSRHFPEQTVAFSPVKAKQVRIELSAVSPPRIVARPTNPSAPGAVPMSYRHHHLSKKMKSSKNSRKLTFKVQELALHTGAVVNEFAAKADFRSGLDDYALRTKLPTVPGTVVNPKEVVNLTGDLGSNGVLHWTAPSGRWVVLRMGYSLEGTTNHPAPKSSTGLEAGELSQKDTRTYMRHYLQTYQAVSGPFGPGSVTSLTTDSSEVGMQNWTPNMVSDFKRLRGYDPIPWLPVLTGVVVGSRGASNDFLWDYRKTIKQLVAKNHYGEIQKVAGKAGLLTYGEALESRLGGMGDDLAVRRYADVPTGANWMYLPGGRPFPVYVADEHGAASVAHIYGKRLVGVETMDSLNSLWRYAPWQLKPIADSDFLLGANKIIIHQSAEQPLDRPPGFSLGFFGQTFSRLDTWANEAKPWITYLSRCSYLLRQGTYVADVAYFYGQGSQPNIMFMLANKYPNVPRGYGYDFVNANMLKRMLHVSDGDLTTKSGMKYRLLYLGGSSRWMTLGVLRRIAHLVENGATVVGKRSIGSPSLKNDPATYAKLATKLFGLPGSTAVRYVGKGRVFPRGSLNTALNELHLSPDFGYKSDNGKSNDLRAIRRRLPHGNLYFVSNRKDRAATVSASFRVSGQAPQLWNAVNGQVSPVSYRVVNGRTQIKLHLAPYGSTFVVFRGPHAPSHKAVEPKHSVLLKILQGPWDVAFQQGRGAPASTVFPFLTSWTANKDTGIKYFSGTATYTKTFRVPSGLKSGQTFLNLGEVRDLAKVKVNGHPAGILWTAPFKVNITKYVHPGTNKLSISVTNLWVNRLIGDQQPGVKKKYTFTSNLTYESDAPLLSSGLLGPVTVTRVSQVTEK